MRYCDTESEPIYNHFVTANAFKVLFPEKSLTTTLKEKVLFIFLNYLLYLTDTN